MIHAFTSTYTGITKKLITEATIKFGDKEYKTSTALWDTGATNTCISKNVVNQLGLISNGKVKIKTPSGEMWVNEYRVDIKLVNENVIVDNVYVTDSEIGNQGLDVLVGMNIISLGDFTVSNHNGQTVFSFRIPSSGRTDYVKMINSSTPVKKDSKIYPNERCTCGSGKKYKNCCGKTK